VPAVEPRASKGCGPCRAGGRAAGIEGVRPLPCRRSNRGHRRGAAPAVPAVEPRASKGRGPCRAGGRTAGIEGARPLPCRRSNRGHRRSAAPAVPAVEPRASKENGGEGPAGRPRPGRDCDFARYASKIAAASRRHAATRTPVIRSVTQPRTGPVRRAAVLPRGSPAPPGQDSDGTRSMPPFTRRPGARPPPQPFLRHGCRSRVAGGPPPQPFLRHGCRSRVAGGPPPQPFLRHGCRSRVAGGPPPQRARFIPSLTPFARGRSPRAPAAPRGNLIRRA